MNQYLEANQHLIPMAQTLSRSANFDQTASPKDWLLVLKALSAQSKRLKVLRSRFKWLLVASIFLFFASIFLFYQQFEILAKLALFLGPVGLIVSIIGMIKFRQLRFSKRMQQQLFQLVIALQEDMKPQAPLRVKLNPYGALQNQYLLSKDNVPRNDLPPRTSSRTNERFRQTWLSIGGKLVDQTHFEISAINDVKRAKIKKRSASGKVKHKTKHKFQATLQVVLKPAVGATAIEQPPVSGVAFEIKPREDQQFIIQTTRQHSGEGLPGNDVDSQQVFVLFALAMAGYQHRNSVQ